MKIKDVSQRQNEKVFEQELSFQEWLEYFSKEPTQQELNEIGKNLLKSKNNENYEPLQGA